MGYHSYQPNRWKGFLIGTVGSIAGLMAMSLYWQYVAPLISKEDSGSEDGSQSKPLDDISVAGQQYEKDESSTAALGRIAYQEVEGERPEPETKDLLSNLVHWSYGMFQGGMYGTMRSAADGIDLKGGLLYGVGLWLLGDELMVPLLGLQKGPTAVSATQHLNRLGAHLAYGLGTATTTNLLHRIL